MEKEMTTKQFLMVLLGTMMVFFAIIVLTAPAFAEPYPKAGIVLDAAPMDNEIMLVDGAGEAWVTSYIPGAQEGDVVAFLMDDNATSSIYDDVGAVQPRMRARSGRIINIDKDADEYVIKDNFGEEWILSEVEDNHVGDGMAVMLFDNNTPDYIKDDIVLKCYYSGL